MTDPAPATVFAHLDATTVLNRAIAEKGIYPAVDPLDSSSRMLSPEILGEDHYNVSPVFKQYFKIQRSSRYYRYLLAQAEAAAQEEKTARYALLLRWKSASSLGAGC